MWEKFTLKLPAVRCDEPTLKHYSAHIKEFSDIIGEELNCGNVGASDAFRVAVKAMQNDEKLRLSFYRGVGKWAKKNKDKCCKKCHKHKDYRKD